jgi:PST family polysaccharide transporter
MIAQDQGIVGLGIFSAAHTLSALFSQFVLGAMGVDFYPRLASISEDNRKMTSMICEQIEVGLLLTFPGMLCVYLFAPWIISLLYSTEFSNAAILLQCLTVGCMFRVLSWPLNYSILAKGRGSISILVDVLVSASHLTGVWIGLITGGLLGAAIAHAIVTGLQVVLLMIVNAGLISFRINIDIFIQVCCMSSTVILASFLLLNKKDSLAPLLSGLLVVGSAAMSAIFLHRRVNAV